VSDGKNHGQKILCTVSFKPFCVTLPAPTSGLPKQHCAVPGDNPFKVKIV
jgi:hypothetical protein